MATVVQEIKGSRKAGWTPQGGRYYGLAVQVLTDDWAIGPRAALLSVGIGAGASYSHPIGAPTEFDLGVFLTGIEAVEDGDSGKKWIVNLSYGAIDWKNTEGGTSGDAASFTANPFTAPPSVKWSTQSEEVACELDRYATPILNAAGDKFDPPLTKVKSTPVCTITRTLPSFDPSWLLQYKDHVNNAEWMGFPAGTVLCQDMTADRVHLPDYGWAWEQTITLAFRPIITASAPNPDAPWQTDTDVVEAGWSIQVLNAGLRSIEPDPTDATKVIAKQILIDGAPTSSEVKLTPDGAYDPNADANYLVFDIYEEADFGGFDLPADLFTASASATPAGGS